MVMLDDKHCKISYLCKVSLLFAVRFTSLHAVVLSARSHLLLLGSENGRRYILPLKMDGRGMAPHVGCLEIKDSSKQRDVPCLTSSGRYCQKEVRSVFQPHGNSMISPDHNTMVRARIVIVTGSGQTREISTAS